MTPQDYLSAVDASLKATCGLTYESLVEVASSIDPDRVQMDVAMRSGTSPEMHASNVADGMTLLRVSSEYPADVAEAFNLRQAALWQFAQDARWPMADGRAQGPEGLTVEVRQMDGVDRGQIEFGFLANPEIPGSRPQMDIKEAVAEGRASLDLVASHDIAPEAPRVGR